MWWGTAEPGEVSHAITWIQSRHSCMIVSSLRSSQIGGTINDNYCRLTAIGEYTLQVCGTITFLTKENNAEVTMIVPYCNAVSRKLKPSDWDLSNEYFSLQSRVMAFLGFSTFPDNWTVKLKNRLKKMFRSARNLADLSELTKPLVAKDNKDQMCTISAFTTSVPKPISIKQSSNRRKRCSSNHLHHSMISQLI